MLVYHQAYDTYHCMTRILKVLSCLSNKEHPIDRIRIYDYYILFLNEIKNITLPSEYSAHKKLMKNTKYNQIQNRKYVFSQLENVQNMAFHAIASFGFIEKDLFEKEIIKLSSIQLPEKLIPDLSKNEEEYFLLVNDLFENLTLKELKQRTKIMDHRYELS